MEIYNIKTNLYTEGTLNQTPASPMEILSFQSTNPSHSAIHLILFSFSQKNYQKYYLPELTIKCFILSLNLLQVVLLPL